MDKQRWTNNTIDSLHLKLIFDTLYLVKIGQQPVGAVAIALVKGRDALGPIRFHLDRLVCGDVGK